MSDKQEIVKSPWDYAREAELRDIADDLIDELERLRTENARLRAIIAKQLY